MTIFRRLGPTRGVNFMAFMCMLSRKKTFNVSLICRHLLTNILEDQIQHVSHSLAMPARELYGRMISQ
jgi:hypothetical protein